MVYDKPSFWRAGAIGWALCIAIVMLWPGDTLPPLPFSWFDLLVHLGTFALLGFLWQGAWPGRSATGMVLGGGVYGFALELAQGSLAVMRHFSWADSVANTLGCLLGVMVARLLFIRPSNG